MIKSGSLGLQTMETIPESGHTASTILVPEASLFSAARPSQLKTEPMMPSTIQGLPGRSASLNIPLARKASFRMREWVKRSSSSRTTPTPGRSASESLKAHITHLGGGRLEKVEIAGTANNTTLLAPVPRRQQRSRAGSPDSRVTQWLDFYPGSPGEAKSQANTSPEAPPSETIPRQRQRSGSNPDLRPAPLRVPSSEKGGSSSSARTPPKPLVRKDSKWKPLPLLPAQPVGRGTPEGGATVAAHAGTKAEGKAHERESTRSHEKPSLGQDDLTFLPIIRFGTPPPTPDSSTGRTAKTHLGGEEGSGQDTEGQRAAEPSDDDTGRKEAPEAKPEEACQRVRHTRQERKWLHVNYKGEAPFLKAWGLDITSASDRVEGLAILKDLMQAEEGGHERESSAAAV